MEIPTHCGLCGGELETRTIHHRQSWGDGICVFENVPALVCKRCEEVWFTAATAQAMDRIMQSKPAPQRYVQVPVYSLAGLES